MGWPGSSSGRMWRKLTLCAWLIVLWLLAHALAFFLHEFAHSFTAWIAGYKANPLALDYGRLSVPNVLFQSGIDENVSYGPIFASDKGWLAALIAAAGVLSNGFFYAASRALYALARRHARPMPGLFAFLLCLMNVGNFFDYVPVRTFATHGDMTTVEKGLGISPWWVVVAAGIPCVVAMWHLMMRLLPDVREFVLAGERALQAVLVTVTSVTMFVFFGASGLDGYGAVSHWISEMSMTVLLVGTTIVCWPRAGSVDSGNRARPVAPIAG